MRVIEKNEVDLWAQTAFEGWSEFTEVADFLHELNQVTAQSKVVVVHRGVGRKTDRDRRSDDRW